jgi:hypothetical protein
VHNLPLTRLHQAGVGEVSRDCNRSLATIESTMTNTATGKAARKRRAGASLFSDVISS